MKPLLRATLHAPRYRAALLCAIAATGHLPAATVTWTGATSNAYNTAGNWNTGTVPSLADDVVIDSNANNPTNFSGNWSRNGSGTTTLTGNGVLNLTGASRLINGGTFNVHGGVLNQTGQYFIVAHETPGTFNQTAGSVTVNHERGFFLSNGNAIESGTSYLLSGGTLTVNSLATGVSEEHLRSVSFGMGASNNLFHISGGSATFARSTTGATSNVFVSRGSTLRASGGVISFANYTRFLVGGHHSGATGETSHIVVDGGSLTVTGGTDLYLGYYDDGQLTLSSGTLSLANILFLGGDGTGSNNTLQDGLGIVNMTGGQLFADNIIARNASSVFNFSGGSITLNGDQTGIVNQDWFQGDAIASYDPDNNLTLITIPEPQLAGLLMIGGLACLARRRAGKASA